MSHDEYRDLLDAATASPGARRNERHHDMLMKIRAASSHSDDNSNVSLNNSNKHCSSLTSLSPGESSSKFIMDSNNCSEADGRDISLEDETNASIYENIRFAESYNPFRNVNYVSEDTNNLKIGSPEFLKQDSPMQLGDYPSVSSVTKTLSDDEPRRDFDREDNYSCQGTVSRVDTDFDRSRQKKKSEKQSKKKSNKSDKETKVTAEAIPGNRGSEDIDKLVEFVEGGSGSTRNNRNNAKSEKKKNKEKKLVKSASLDDDNLFSTEKDPSSDAAKEDVSSEAPLNSRSVELYTKDDSNVEYPTQDLSGKGKKRKGNKKGPQKELIGNRTGDSISLECTKAEDDILCYAADLNDKESKILDKEEEAIAVNSNSVESETIQKNDSSTLHTLSHAGHNCTDNKLPTQAIKMGNLMDKRELTDVDNAISETSANTAGHKAKAKKDKNKVKNSKNREFEVPIRNDTKVTPKANEIKFSAQNKGINSNKQQSSNGNNAAKDKSSKAVFQESTKEAENNSDNSPDTSDASGSQLNGNLDLETKSRVAKRSETPNPKEIEEVCLKQTNPGKKKKGGEHKKEKPGQINRAKTSEKHSGSKVPYSEVPVFSKMESEKCSKQNSPAEEKSMPRDLNKGYLGGSEKDFVSSHHKSTEEELKKPKAQPKEMDASNTFENITKDKTGNEFKEFTTKRKYENKKARTEGIHNSISEFPKSGKEVSEHESNRKFSERECFNKASETNRHDVNAGSNENTEAFKTVNYYNRNHGPKSYSGASKKLSLSNDNTLERDSKAVIKNEQKPRYSTSKYTPTKGLKPSDFYFESGNKTHSVSGRVNSNYKSYGKSFSPPPLLLPNITKPETKSCDDKEMEKNLAPNSENFPPLQVATSVRDEPKGYNKPVSIESSAVSRAGIRKGENLNYATVAANSYDSSNGNENLKAKKEILKPSAPEEFKSNKINSSEDAQPTENELKPQVSEVKEKSHDIKISVKTRSVSCQTLPTTFFTKSEKKFSGCDHRSPVIFCGVPSEKSEYLTVEFGFQSCVLDDLNIQVKLDKNRSGIGKVEIQEVTSEVNEAVVTVAETVDDVNMANESKACQTNVGSGTEIEEACLSEQGTKISVDSDDTNDQASENSSSVRADEEKKDQVVVEDEKLEAEVVEKQSTDSHEEGGKDAVEEVEQPKRNMNPSNSNPKKREPAKPNVSSRPISMNKTMSYPRPRNRSAHHGVYSGHSLDDALMLPNASAMHPKFYSAQPQGMRMHFRNEPTHFDIPVPAGSVPMPRPDNPYSIPHPSTYQVPPSYGFTMMYKMPVPYSVPGGYPHVGSDGAESHAPPLIGGGATGYVRHGDMEPAQYGVDQTCQQGMPNYAPHDVRPYYSQPARHASAGPSNDSKNMPDFKSQSRRAQSSSDNNAHPVAYNGAAYWESIYVPPPLFLASNFNYNQAVEYMYSSFNETMNRVKKGELTCHRV